MNGSVTLCPHCQTRFRVTEDQLRARQGMVRCGRCLTPFNAAEHLEEGKTAPPEPQPVAIDSVLSEPSFSPSAAPAATNPLPVPAETGFAPSTAPRPATETEAPVPVVAEPTDVVHTHSVPTIQEEPGKAEALHDDLFPHAPPSWRVPEPKSPYRPLWLLGSLLLLTWLLLQLAVFFRSDLVIRFPAAKPLLSGYCQLTGCKVDLPRRPELLSIEASELEPVNPERPEIVALDALLHNLAPYAQTYPHLELTLADAQGTPLGRRIFRPADYLTQVENAEFGIAPKQEVAVRLYLNTSDLKPEGYRIALFYPK